MAAETYQHDPRPDCPLDTIAQSSCHAFNDILASANERLPPPPLHVPSIDTVPQDHASSSADLASASLPVEVENAKAMLLSVPVATVDHGQPSQPPLFIPGASDIVNSGEPEGLPPEIAQADVSIAADGSFVQTTSALAARELKKCYDRILGVGSGAQGVVRSPYAITAVQDEYGAKVFRISHRTAHDVAADDTSSPGSSTGSPVGHAIGHRRRARLSVHDFLPTSIFKPSPESNLPQNTTSMALSSGSTPPTNISVGSTLHGRRKLRKTRSNSDLQLRGAPNTAGDNAGHLSPPPRSEHFSMEIRDELTAGADPFCQVLGWSAELAVDTKPPTRGGRSSIVPVIEDRREPQDRLAPADHPDNQSARRPSVSTSVALSSAVGEGCIPAPFGDNVRYTAPFQRSAPSAPSQTPQLREMQSFESGLTAKARDDRDGTPVTPRSTSIPSDNQDVACLAAKKQARFSTVVFDVLQTYTGLPLPSAFLSAPPTGATIKLSLADSANPKDDPRFVIWGEVQPERTHVDDASVSHSQSSHTDLSTSGPGSRKRSNARSSQLANDTPQVVVNAEVDPQTVIIAATVERWIAQLTSQFDYDELLNFLLTYRTYISPVDLCHLLICRFYWTLECSSSVQDGTVRRIVGVRTFIAIRYWLLTFFREDFLPNTELRSLFASWLNTLSKDVALKDRPDVLNIVRKLKKVVRECKAAHFRQGRAGVERPSMDTRGNPSSSGVMDMTQGASNRSNGNTNDHKLNAELDDSDVDLDFTSMTGPRYTDVSNNDGAKNTPMLMFSPPIPSLQRSSTATPSANTILLSQPLSMTILGHVKSTKPGTDTPLTQTPTSLPVQHSAISRVFVNTIGRLGRWKRVLNARSSVSPPHCGDMSAFDLELNATGDLLAVRGGVEEYLKMLNLSPPLIETGAGPATDGAPSESDNNQLARPPGLAPPAVKGPRSDIEQATSSGSSYLEFGPLDEVDETTTESTFSRPIRDSQSTLVTESEATDESNQVTSEASPPLHWVPEVVSLDDYDLSDSGSSSHSPARVRRLPRRLELRRDFQFVRRSTETVSSMGIRSQSSLASSVKSASVNSRQSTHSNGRQLMAGPVHQWQIELISDDEEEAGDAEAALRRLEGQIDLDRQREKDMKVGRWLKSASKRYHRDSVSSARSGSQVSEAANGNEEEQVNTDPPNNEKLRVSVDSVRSSTLGATATSLAEDANEVSATPSLESMSMSTPVPPANDATPLGVASDRDRSGSVSTQVSVSSNANSRTSSSADMAQRPSILGRAPRNPGGPVPSKFGSSHLPASHRSFILMHRSETLAQQFAIIEAELFVKIKFEELILHQWGQSLEDVDIKDWVQFVKNRAKLKNSGKPLDSTSTAKLSSILALRARFDLLVNFTSSEILLSHASERVMVVEKFIRIAWKAYLHNNFSTLVALMAGLQTRWVNLAMGRHWHKLGMWEQRIFDDLKKFTSRPGAFKYLRNATAALVDAHPLHVGVQDGVSTPGALGGASGASKSKNSDVRDAPPACVPFLGVYLAKLYEYERLPDYIDPTAPSEPVLIDGETGTLSPPSYPEAFFNLQPLPRDLILEPLINVHKQRLIAGVIKSFVAGQHIATNIPFEVDQRCYQKCFRLRSLDSEALHGIAKSFTDL